MQMSASTRRNTRTNSLIAGLETPEHLSRIAENNQHDDNLNKQIPMAQKTSTRLLENKTPNSNADLRDDRSDDNHDAEEEIEEGDKKPAAKFQSGNEAVQTIIEEVGGMEEFLGGNMIESLSYIVDLFTDHIDDEQEKIFHLRDKRPVHFTAMTVSC
jgi:hypothetical protein